MSRRLACIVLLGILAAAGCQKKTPPPPSTPGGGSQGDTITGRERIGWDQQASSAAELATYRFAIYLDGTRSEAADVNCAGTASSTGFACSGKLPPMSNGAHTLELSTFAVDGNTVVESARSEPLRVTVQAVTPGDTSAAVAWVSGAAGVTTDGTALAVERIADGLSDPVDIAVAPDGRVFVAERAGRLRTFGGPDGAETVAAFDVEGGELIAIAIDPQFARTHFIYGLYAAPARDGSTYRVARVRELEGMLGERAILLADIARASVPPAASLRVTSDGRLLVAIGGSSSAAASSYEGKLLRLESDGTTPREQNGNPVVGAGLDRPVSAAWDPARATAWIVDRGESADILASVVMAPAQAPRSGVRYRLPEPGIGSVAVYRGTRLAGFDNNLLLASSEGQHILRLRLPQDSGGRQFTTERLLQDRVGPILAVTAGLDGLIYFVTADAAGRIGPAER